MRARRLLVAVSFLAVVPSPAHALVPHEAFAVVGNQYAVTEIHIVEGDTLSLTNLDTVPHDLVSTAVVNGKPLFGSKPLNLGERGPVTGVENLSTGVFDVNVFPFVCQFHSNMVGNITVHRLPA